MEGGPKYLERMARMAIVRPDKVGRNSGARIALTWPDESRALSPLARDQQCHSAFQGWLLMSC